MKNAALLVLVVALLPLPALAQKTDAERDAEIATLRATVERLSGRLEALEAERAAPAPTGPVVPLAPVSPAAPVAGAASSPTPAAAVAQGAVAQVAPATAPPHSSDLPERQTIDEDAEVAPRADNALPPGQEGLEGYFPIRGTGTWMRLSGYAKLDAMYDTDDAGDPDLFVTSAIPAGAQDGRSSFNMHARQTRFTIEARRPTDYGWLRFVLQNDFFGSGGSYGYRLRHAYGQLGNTYAGYGFSAFMDLDATPDTLDFAGIGAMPFGRLASVRQYFPLQDGNQLFLAAEHNAPEISGPGRVDARTTTPNLLFGMRHEGDEGHLQATVLLRHLGYTGDAGSDSATGGGATLSGSWAGIGGDGFLVYGALGGRGIAAYTGDLAGLGLDAVVDGDGSLEALDEWGGWVGYTYPWGRGWRSTVTYGRLYLERSALLDPAAFRRSDYAAANLVYSPAPSWSWGVELLYGQLQLQDGGDGDVFRLQTSLKYDFIK